MTAGAERRYTVVDPAGAELEVSAANPHAALVMSIPPGAGLVSTPGARDRHLPLWKVRLTAWGALPEWNFVLRREDQT